MNRELAAEILGVFHPEAGVRIEKLDKAGADYQKAKQIEELFTGGVEALRTLVPNERVRSLANAIWDVFHHRHVVMALGPRVPSLTFAAYGKPDNLRAIVLSPHTWPEMANADPLMQLGAVLMVGSQAVDYYNGRLLTDGSEITIRRAKANEAELLRTFGMNFTPNTYQQEILTKFPTFDPALDYVRKPVEPRS